MKAILFDLGDTLESSGALVSDALSTLQALRSLKDADGRPPLLGLVSDYKPAASPAEIPGLLQEYYDIITGLGIREFFEPVAVHVTLSTELGIEKPKKAIFRHALDKLSLNLPFDNAAFITENMSHVTAVRKFGMKGICVKGGPTPSTWDVEKLTGILPVLSWMQV